MSAGERLKRLRKLILQRDGDECWYCGLKMLFNDTGRSIGNRATLEHLTDRKHGGGNNLENLRLAHGNCNSFVQNKLFCQKVQWRARFKRRTRHLRSEKARFLALQRQRELEGEGE